jgi:hypothetical protein
MIDDLWYKNGVFYCLSDGTHMDANGDGPRLTCCPKPTWNISGMTATACR